MATYVSLLKFTPQGVEKFQATADRAAAFKNEAKKLGLKVTANYWTLGAFDGLLIFEAPDDETATAAMLTLSSHGSVATQTSRAFGATEIKQIIAKLPAVKGAT
ncbi:MAG: GYD domain-containing protein [Pirellulales bacterium]|nr:GYD domain-containing protein [Pirellulales bacterium]